MSLERGPTKDHVYCCACEGVQKEIPCHFVENNEAENWTILTVLFLDSAALSLPHSFMSSINFSWEIPVEGLSHSRCARVLWCCQFFVVTLHMLVFEMRIEDLGAGKHAKELVMTLFPMNQFVRSLCFDCADERNYPPEH